ncbi:MAG: hypothetical protein F6K54_32955 [Okeania sp. SIO3B5]|uniref:HEAT repeat domain-containing protein n=1 Tax=Okeania sp. SIO3B5 TaxID=2607811 RepID=UPI001400ADD2|nr:HEAT repeat domain-containing protein [Okeania sp. SIO3B5]NEO57465.1 hypothetical protein [Okeania sp. SIO3B5]
MWTPYLESVCQYYAKWWEVYTLTDVRGKKSLQQQQHISPLLDLGLMVQTIESEEKQGERPEYKIERLTVLEGLRKYAPNHVLLVGRPGSGKSTALARLLLEEAEKLRSPLSPPFPRGETRETPAFQRKDEGQTTETPLETGEIQETPPFLRGVGGDRLLEEAEKLRSPLSPPFPRGETRETSPFQRKDEGQTTETPLETGEIKETPPFLRGVGGDRKPDTSATANTQIDSASISEAEKLRSPLSPPFPRGETRETPAFLRKDEGQTTETPLGRGETRETHPLETGETGKTPPFLRGAGGDRPKIPILIELRYSQTSILSRIQAFIHKHHPTINIDTATLETLLRQGEFLLLFDGFNEMASEAARQLLRMFRQDYPQTAMVFTTRDLSLGGDLGIEKRLEMQPLTESQMQEFVCAYLPFDGEKLWQQLQGRLRELGETPMFLLMLCDVFAHNNVVPANLGLVFRLFTQIYSIRLKQDVPVDENSRRWWDRLLQELAWVMTNGESKTEIMVAISRQKAEEVLTEFLRGEVVATTDCAMRWLEDLLEHHLIQVGDDGQISFRHQLLQEYYVAERLLWQLDGLSDYELQWDYLNYLKWTEVVGLMLGLVEDEELAVRVVRLALEVDWFLGARLVGEVQRRFQERVFGEVEQLELPVLVKVRLAALTKSDVAVPGLVKLLEDSDKYVRRGAADTLGEIRSKTAVPGLIKLLEDSDYLVRYSAEKALGEIGSETAIPELIKLLENSDYSVRESAAEALGEIGSETAIPELIKLLENSDYSVRESAAEALGEIGSETAIPELIKLLENSDYSVRETVANTLGKIGSGTVIFELTKLLEHPNTDLRKTAAYLIEKIGFKSVSYKSIKHSEYIDYDYDYPMSCTYSQDEIDPKSAIRSLMIFLKYEYSSSIFPSSIADALAEIIESEIAIHGSIKPLEDIEYPEDIEYIDIISAVINDLSKIGSELAIEVLIKILILNKYDTDLLFIVADASKKIVSEAAITSLNKVMIPMFIELLEDEDTDPDIYYRAVDILLDIDSPSVIPGLIQLLEYSDSDVRKNAAEALGKIGSENTIVELTKKLQNDRFVNQSLSETIYAIQTIQQRLQYYKPTPKIPMSNTLSHNYALLIGVGDCKYPNWSLPVTVKDVQAIKSFLINPDLCGYIDNQNYLRFLRNEQATKQNILDNLNWLQEQAKNDPEATILVYYSGHDWLDKSTQNYYLIPHDTKPLKLQKTALPATEFNNALQQISAQKLLVIIDSCHAQGMATAKETEELELPENFSQTALPKNLIEELRKGTGRAVFTSSTGEESSWIRSDGKMSIYTDHFLEALHGGGNKPGDKFVTVSNLMNYVGKTVPESARQLGRKQTPIFDFSQTEDFPVALLCGGKGLPDGGWEEVKSEVRENISVGRDVYSAGGDNIRQIDVSGNSGIITIGDIGSKRSRGDSRIAPTDCV